MEPLSQGESEKGGAVGYKWHFTQFVLPLLQTENPANIKLLKHKCT